MSDQDLFSDRVLFNNRTTINQSFPFIRVNIHPDYRVEKLPGAVMTAQDDIPWLVSKRRLVWAQLMGCKQFKRGEETGWINYEQKARAAHIKLHDNYSQMPRV